MPSSRDCRRIAKLSAEAQSQEGILHGDDIDEKRERASGALRASVEAKLRSRPDGFTIAELARRTGASKPAIESILRQLEAVPASNGARFMPRPARVPNTPGKDDPVVASRFLNVLGHTLTAHQGEMVAKLAVARGWRDISLIVARGGRRDTGTKELKRRRSQLLALEQLGIVTVSPDRGVILTRPAYEELAPGRLSGLVRRQ